MSPFPDLGTHARCIAKQAKCSVQDDEDRMLGAIAGAFGSLEAFSKDVRKTLGSILRRGGSQLEQEVV